MVPIEFLHRHGHQGGILAEVQEVLNNHALGVFRIEVTDRAGTISKMHGFRTAVIGDAIDRPILLVAFLGIVRGHKRPAGATLEQAFEEKRALDFGRCVTLFPAKRLHLEEQCFLDHGLLFPGKGLFVEPNLATVQGVPEDVVQSHFPPRFASPGIPASPVEFSAKSRERRIIGEPVKHEADARRFLRVFHQTFIVIHIAKRDVTPIPKPFGGTLVHLVAGSICRHLSLKLCKVEEDIAEKPSHRMVGIEALGDRHELGSVAVKDVHQDMKVFDGAGEPINFIGQDTVDASIADILQEFSQGWPVDRIGRKAAVLIHPVDGVAFLTLTVGFQLFPLSLQ